MPPVHEVRYYKAQGIGSEEVPSVHIILETEFPAFANSKPLTSLREVFEDDAVLLERTLNTTLPGGTYDALLRRMLERRASHFVVPFGA